MVVARRNLPAMISSAENMDYCSKTPASLSNDQRAVAKGQRLTVVSKEGMIYSCIHFAVYLVLFHSWERGLSRSLMELYTQLLPRRRLPRLAMSSTWRSWCRLISMVVVEIFMGIPSSAQLVNPMTPVSWTLVERTVTQDQGAWIVDYRLRYTDRTGIIVLPEELGFKVAGWVSNSRIASHATPRWSSLVISHGPVLSTSTEVVAAVDEGHRCHERLVVSVWTEDLGTSRNGTGAQLGGAAQHGLAPIPLTADQSALLPLSVGPSAIMRVRLRLDHQHILYGDYDPLLSARAVELTLGQATIGDVVPLDREQYLAQPRFNWPEPLEEHRDTRHAISLPDSLHIEAHVPGHQYYRFPERPVRYNTRMCLRFWYLIAAGTEGDCQAVVAQYKETPFSWRKLENGSFEQMLKTVGRWTKVERIFQTDTEATTLTLEFKIKGETEVGEMWIDDVGLEPIGWSIPSGP